MAPMERVNRDAEITTGLLPLCSNMVMASASRPAKSSSALSALVQFFFLSTTSALLGIIVFITYLTNHAQTVTEQKGDLGSILTADVSTTVTLLRALQGLLTTSLAAALSRTFSYLQWA